MKALVVLLFRLYTIILLLRVILTWLKINPGDYPLVRLVHRLTEPVLEPLRRLVDTTKSGFDLSPLLAMLILWLLTRILVAVF